MHHKNSGVRMTAPSSAAATAQTVVAVEVHEMPAWILAIALACGVWYFFVLVVQGIGSTQLYRYYSSKPKAAVSPKLNIGDIPHITILRPVKGLEPHLYECLASTFRQVYPTEKLTVYFCVASANDPAYVVLQRLLVDFPQFDAKVFVEEEDPNLSGHGGESTNLGPNPKIRNMSRGYREAKGDIIWIIDCNVWIAKGVAGRMVDKLCGCRNDGTSARPYKFVHQLPLVVDCVSASAVEDTQGLGVSNGVQQVRSAYPLVNNNTNSPRKNPSLFDRISKGGGGRLEEMFMASSHAKFYTAINTVSVAPCIVGKSTMFRRSHLNYLTSAASPYSRGIDFFSDNICEDHLIGDLLWRKKVPEELAGEKWNKHGLVFGDLAIQPMAQMSVREFIARRSRWLRVRKWTVPLATFVEPGVEPLLCSAYGSFAITTLPWFNDKLGVPQTWAVFAAIWVTNVITWMTVDWFVYTHLHSGASIEVDSDTPTFAQAPVGGSRRHYGEWLLAWLGRELLALPVWSWACLCGTTVAWRGKMFRVNLDMKVIEIGGRKSKVPPEGGP